MPRLDRLLETALYVDDLDRATAFYVDVIGATLMLETPTLHACEVAGRSVLLLFKRGASNHTQHLPGGTIPPHDGQGPLHIAFGVEPDELAVWERHLGEHGVAIEGRTDWPKGGRSLYFRDPDGHLVEIASRGLWPIF